MIDNVTLKTVILAAGSSSRMGRPKQLLRVGGKTMLDRAIRAAMDAGLGKPVLVLGASLDQVLEQSELAKICEVVANMDFALGQSTSLAAGVRRVMGGCDGAVFMLCDQPFIRAELLADLAEHFSRTRPDVLYPVYRGQRGNPVIIGSRLFPRLLKATGDAGARFLFQDPELDIVAREVSDRGVVVDIDTPEEYRAIPHE